MIDLHICGQCDRVVMTLNCKARSLWFNPSLCHVTILNIWTFYSMVDVHQFIQVYKNFIFCKLCMIENLLSLSKAKLITWSYKLRTKIWFQKMNRTKLPKHMTNNLKYKILFIHAFCRHYCLHMIVVSRLNVYIKSVHNKLPEIDYKVNSNIVLHVLRVSFSLGFSEFMLNVVITITVLAQNQLYFNAIARLVG